MEELKKALVSDIQFLQEQIANCNLPQYKEYLQGRLDYATKTLRTINNNNNK